MHEPLTVLRESSAAFAGFILFLHLLNWWITLCKRLLSFSAHQKLGRQHAHSSCLSFFLWQFRLCGLSQRNPGTDSIFLWRLLPHLLLFTFFSPMLLPFDTISSTTRRLNPSKCHSATHSGQSFFQAEIKVWYVTSSQALSMRLMQWKNAEMVLSELLQGQRHLLGHIKIQSISVQLLEVWAHLPVQGAADEESWEIQP